MKILIERMGNNNILVETDFTDISDRGEVEHIIVALENLIDKLKMI